MINTQLVDRPAPCWIGRLPVETITQVLCSARDLIDAGEGGKKATVEMVRLGHVSSLWRELTLERIQEFQWGYYAENQVTAILDLLAIEPRRAIGVQRLILIAGLGESLAVHEAVARFRGLKEVDILSGSDITPELVTALAGNSSLEKLGLSGPIEISLLLEIFAGCPNLHQLDLNKFEESINTVGGDRDAAWTESPTHLFPRHLRSFFIFEVSAGPASAFVAQIVENAPDLTSLGIARVNSPGPDLVAAVARRAPDILKFQFDDEALARTDPDPNFSRLVKCKELKFNSSTAQLPSQYQLPLLQTLVIGVIAHDPVDLALLAEFISTRRGVLQVLRIAYLSPSGETGVGESVADWALLSDACIAANVEIRWKFNEWNGLGW